MSKPKKPSDPTEEKRKKTGGRDVVPGQVLNPNGPPKGLTQLRKHGAKQLAEKMEALLGMTLAEVKIAYTDPESDVLTTSLCSIIIKASETGDMMRLNFMVERIAGPVPKQINISGGIDTQPKADLTKLTDKELRQWQELASKVHPSVPDEE